MVCAVPSSPLIFLEMDIAVYGLGYVGLTTSLYFAEMGHCVVAVDVDETKLHSLHSGRLPFVEHGLQDLLEKNIAEKRISFSSSLKTAAHCEVHFICLGTPSDQNDLPQTYKMTSLVDDLLQGFQNPTSLVIKSTVPVGFCDQLDKSVKETLKRAGKNFLVNVISNPEFLREGWATQDTFYPHRVVIGTECPRAEDLMRELYKSLQCPILVMSRRSSEMAKYAANALLATKISVMNELSRLTEKNNSDIEMVRQAVGLDPRIGEQFLNSGVGFGGSCLPKDLRALIAQGKQVGLELEIMKSVTQVNFSQKKFHLEKMKSVLGDLKNKKIAVWGVAFKADVDDIREAPSLFFISELLNLGAQLSVFDPLALDQLKNYLRQNHGTSSDIRFCNSPLQALESADALLVLTECEEFRRADLSQVKSLLKGAKLFDARNVFHPMAAKKAGLSYYGVGRSGDGL